MRIRFEDCVFDSDTRQVIRDSAAVPLSPKAFQLLEILIRERPKAIKKRQLHTELWPGVFVTDANLPNLVAELRTALGDHARRPRIIRTVRSFGYAFSAETSEATSGAATSAAGPLHRLIWGDREIALARGENVIGRAAESRLFIDHSSVSRRHARIQIGAAGAVLEDLGSKNGTLLNGKRLTRTESLSDKDSIEIGPACFVFRVFKHTESTASTSGVDRDASDEVSRE
jgi:DNA-binding winged helix-turn-helix (wHTH) protein